MASAVNSNRDRDITLKFVQYHMLTYCIFFVFVFWSLSILFQLFMSVSAAEIKIGTGARPQKVCEDFEEDGERRGVVSLLSRLGGLGIILSAHICVPGGAPAENEFYSFCSCQRADGRSDFVDL